MFVIGWGGSESGAFDQQVDEFNGFSFGGNAVGDGVESVAESVGCGSEHFIGGAGPAGVGD